MKMVCKSIHSGSVVLVSLCAVLVTGTGKGGIAIPSFLGARKAQKDQKAVKYSEAPLSAGGITETNRRDLFIMGQ